MLMIVMTMIGNKDNNEEIPHMYQMFVFFYVELTPSQMKVFL